MTRRADLYIKLVVTLSEVSLIYWILSQC